MITELICKIILQLLENIFYTESALLITISQHILIQGSCNLSWCIVCAFYKKLNYFDGTETWMLVWQQCYWYVSCHSSNICYSSPKSLMVWRTGVHLQKDIWGDWIRLAPGTWGLLDTLSLVRFLMVMGRDTSCLIGGCKWWLQRMITSCPVQCSSFGSSLMLPAAC